MIFSSKVLVAISLMSAPPFERGIVGLAVLQAPHSAENLCVKTSIYAKISPGWPCYPYGQPIKNKLCVFLLSRERCNAVKMLHFRRAINAANLAFYIYGKIRTRFEINPSIIFKLPKKIPGRVKFNLPF